MGWQGLDGLCITPQYGKRLQIAPIFIQRKFFEYTDNDDHQWIESYCKSCRRCQKNCPTQAIYGEKIISNESIPDLVTKTCIDRIKCFLQFSKTL